MFYSRTTVRRKKYLDSRYLFLSSRYFLVHTHISYCPPCEYLESIYFILATLVHRMKYLDLPSARSRLPPRC